MITDPFGRPHAFLSPSDAGNWMACPGKPALCEGEPDKPTPASEYGTLAHEYAARWLKGKGPPAEWAAERIRGDGRDLLKEDDLAMRNGVERYVAAVLSAKANFEKQGARVYLTVEQPLPIGWVTGEKNADGSYATGTPDVVMLADFGTHAHLEVWDLKFGTGYKVKVENNLQLSIYALTAFLKEQVLHDIRTVDLVIHQPRLVEDPTRWTITPDDLFALGKKVTEAAAVSLSLRNKAEARMHLTAGEDQCRFCRVRARCPELARFVQSEVLTEFQGVKTPQGVQAVVQGKTMALPENEAAAMLGAQLKKLDLIRIWCDAVEGEANYLALEKGVKIPGFKVVDGRAGNRKIADEEEPNAIATLEEHKVPEKLIYTAPKLKTPTQLEQALKGPTYQKAWAALQAFITRSDPKPALVPESDPRPPKAIAATADEFGAAR